MADKKNEFIKRRKELAGLSTLTTSVNKNSPLNKLGPSGKFSSALKDMPKDKPSKFQMLLKRFLKNHLLAELSMRALKLV
jgi:hypothetical protein